MRAATVRRSALAASVASLVLLATACGGSSDDSDSKSTSPEKSASAEKSASPEASAEAKTSDVKALTTAELEKAALVDGEAGEYKFEKGVAADVIDPADATTDKAECLPFAHAVFAVAQNKPVGFTQHTATGSEKEALTMMVALSSYDGTGSADLFAAVGKAAAACASGFTATVNGDAQKISDITEAKVTGGEEAAGWTLNVEMEGTKVPFGLVVSRQGGTVATFTTVSMASMMGKGDVDKVQQPAAVVEAQMKKLA